MRIIFKTIYELKKYSAFLNNGLFVFNTSFDKAINSSENITITFSQNFQNKKMYIINKLRNFLYKKGFKIYSQDKIFEGEEIIFPSSNYGYKILNKRKILTIYYNKEFMQKIINNKNIISKLFNVPKYNEYNYKYNYTVEEKIISKYYVKDNFVKYLLTIKNKAICKKKLFDICTKNKNYNIIKSNFKKNEYLEEFSCNIQHCDMWSGNVLFNNNKYFIIDYENVEIEYILYDFFSFIYSEYYIYKDSSLLKNYFCGKYNKYLSKYFNNNNLKFDEKELEKYFKTFIIIFCNKRFAHLKRKSLKKELCKINKLYNSMKAGINYD